jgi:hypothetical protein
MIFTGVARDCTQRHVEIARSNLIRPGRERTWAVFQREFDYCQKRAAAETQSALLSQTVEASIAHRRLVAAYDARARRLQLHVENRPEPDKE